MELMIRSGYFDNEIIKLCDHIEIKGKTYEHDDGCEYTQDIQITCNICKEKHTVTMLIN